MNANFNQLNIKIETMDKIKTIDKIETMDEIESQELIARETIDHCQEENREIQEKSVEIMKLYHSYEEKLKQLKKDMTTMNERSEYNQTIIIEQTNILQLITTKKQLRKEFDELELLRQQELVRFREEERIRLEKHTRRLEKLTFNKQILEQAMKNDDNISATASPCFSERRINNICDLNATFQQTKRIDAIYRGQTYSLYKRQAGNWKKGQWIDENQQSYSSPRQFWLQFAKSQGFTGKSVDIWSTKNKLKCYDEDGTYWDIAINKDRIVYYNTLTANKV